MQSFISQVTKFYFYLHFTQLTGVFDTGLFHRLIAAPPLTQQTRLSAMQIPLATAVIMPKDQVMLLVRLVKQYKDIVENQTHISLNIHGIFQKGAFIHEPPILFFCYTFISFFIFRQGDNIQHQ